MPMGGLAVAGGAAVLGPLLGGIIGAQQSQADRNAANAAAQAAYAQIQQMGAPPDAWANIILQQFKQAGIYSPQLEQQVQLGVTQAQNVQANPDLQNAQMNALNQLSQFANTGNTAQTQAQLNQAEQQVGAATQGQLQGIRQNMQSRGLAGSGSELAQQLSAAQGGANLLSNQALQAAAQNQQTSMQGNAQAGAMAGQMNQQQYQQALQRAQSADQRNLYNTQQQQAIQNANAGLSNQAQQQNLGTAQQLSNANVAQNNQLTQQQAQALNNQWQQQLQLQQAKAGALLGQAGQYNNQAGQTAGLYQGIGSGVGSGAGAILGYLGKQGTPSSSGNTNNAQVTSTGPTSDMSGTSSAQAGLDSNWSNVGNLYNGGVVKDPKQMALDKMGCYYNGGTIKSSGAADQFNKFDMANRNIPLSEKLAAEAMAFKHQQPQPHIQQNFAMGNVVPGKASVPGDNIENDKVLIAASPGEVVLPKTVVDHGPDGAYGFLHAIINKHKAVK